jgi:hypothetical protein
MTAKDLDKLLSQYQQTTTLQDEELNKIKSKLRSTTRDSWKKFYIWPETNHKVRYKNSNGQCCFYHLLGPEKKDGRDMPLLPWQQLFWRMLHERRKVWVKKSRGIGFSTLALYIIAYKVLTEFKPGDRVVIITGIRMETAADLIRRFKLLFQKNFPEIYIQLSKQKDTIAIISGIIVECYPAGHTDSIRGLDRVKVCWVDEADMFEPAEARNIRSCVEFFLTKPNSENMYLVLSSTPAKPDGLFATIEKEDPSIYYKMFVPYQMGLEGPSPIYTQEFIDEMRLKSPEFSREMELQYIGKVGTVFSQLSIELAQKQHYDPDEIIPARYSIGVDPGFGTFGIVVTRFINNRIEVVVAEDHKSPDFGFTEAINRIWEIRRKYGDDYFIHCDASNPIIWKELKRQCNETPYDNEYVYGKIVEYEKNGWDIRSIMRIVPVPFSNNHAQMLQHTKSLLDENLISIDKRFDKLLISLRTATAKEYSLLKEGHTSYHDVLDAFRLSLQAYKRDNK